ncbi:MAG: HAD family phosphatase [Acidimicrobiia bacterium]|nr:HAD family phosphatase [Acidimicrobiia bacterium]
MTDYRAVLWDFGGVFTASPFAGVRAWAVDRGLDPVVVLETIFGPYDQDTDHAWHRLERGEVSLPDAMAAIAEQAAVVGFALDPDNPFSFLAGAMRDEDRSPMVDAVRAIREAGLATGLITNNVKEFGDGWRSLLPVDELFDVVVDSSAAGIRKPDPAIYRLALDRLGIEAHQAVFVDDLPGNVAAARALGITSVLVPEVQAVTAAGEVRTLLGLS